jgi:hypothetical protein
VQRVSWLRLRSHSNAFRHMAPGSAAEAVGSDYVTPNAPVLCKTASAVGMRLGACLCGYEIVFTCPGRWKRTDEGAVAYGCSSQRRQAVWLLSDGFIDLQCH